MAVTCLSFPTCNLEIIVLLPGGFRNRSGFWAEAQEFRGCREQRRGREGNCNGLFFFFFGLERRDVTHHSFASKSATSGSLYICFCLLPCTGAAHLPTADGGCSQRCPVLRLEAMPWGCGTTAGVGDWCRMVPSPTHSTYPERLGRIFHV